MSEQGDLERFVALLRKWNAVQNLVSRETVEDIWSRHIHDSLQLMKFVRVTDRSVVDLGSGGGLPAIPMAIASRGAERRFTLLEPIAKKASFLRVVGRELDLPLTVQTTRAEQLDSRETFDLVTARALTALPQLLAYAGPLLQPSGHALFLKGRNYRQELDAAAANFHFDVLTHPSESEPEGVVLEITNLRAKSAA